MSDHLIDFEELGKKKGNKLSVSSGERAIS